jgi:hypothetical protein
MISKLIIRFLDYIGLIGLSELDKHTDVKIWPFNNMCNTYSIFPSDFNLWLDGDGFGVRYWFFKGKYLKMSIDKRPTYPEVITQYDIKPYIIKWKLENCNK